MSKVCYFEARALALVIIRLFCFIETDGAYHYPASNVDPDASAVIDGSSERVMAYGCDCHGILSVFAEVVAEWGEWATSETDS